jgi:hypothetical protein
MCSSLQRVGSSKEYSVFCSNVEFHVQDGACFYYFQTLNFFVKINLQINQKSTLMPFQALTPINNPDGSQPIARSALAEIIAIDVVPP